EAPGQALVAPRRSEPGLEAAQIRERLPEKLLHEHRVPAGVGGAQLVARGRFRPAQHAQAREAKSGGVAHVRQRDAVAELGEEKAHDVAPRREAAGEPLLVELARDLRGRVRRYELAKLREDAELGSGW